VDEQPSFVYQTRHPIQCSYYLSHGATCETIKQVYIGEKITKYCHCATAHWNYNPTALKRVKQY